MLSRKVGEKIMIGDEIILTIVSIESGGKVRIGVQAPIEVPVYREEIYRAIKAERLHDSME